MDSQAQRAAAGCLVVDREVCVTSWVTWGITRTVPSKNASYQSEAVPRLRRGSNTDNSVQSPPRKTVGWNHISDIRARLGPTSPLGGVGRHF
ncbi:hypothetical protein WUBG_13994 [Wuchereria bancrofti]|uniref:Uncharacterized protein n=1 Tax=Wuchereria bancrofti TaxID=6293 RepID=J9EDL7_WUCBA|nr:hypothetical protein WUBG_13994 [Wuchereria bancrofti]